MPSNPINIPPFSGVTYGPIAVRGTLRDLSIASTNSGSLQVLSGNPTRNYLFLQNLNTQSIGVNPTGGAATINAVGTLTLTNLGTLVFESSFIPTSAVAITGNSGTGGVTIWEG